MAAFPESWWRDRPLVFGHRGASHAAPQNTLAAFRAAVEAGADGVELDVYLSADGIPVVIHDEDVSSTTDGSGYITQMPLAQIKALDAGSTFSPAFAGEPIPTLEEVLAEVGHKLLIDIELKYSPRQQGLEAAVASLVARMGLQERLWFSSFHPHTLYAIRQLAPAIPCGLLYDPMSFGTRLLGIVTPHEAIHPQAALVRGSLVRRAHRHHRRVVTWTVDDAPTARRMARRQVDVVITNEPARLLAALTDEEEGG